MRENAITAKKEDEHSFIMRPAAASTYDTWADIQMLAAQKVSELFPIKMCPTNILEIGCGTGYLSKHIVQYFPHSRILLTDISPDMLQQCSRKFGLFTNVSFEVMDGETIQIVPYFDLIVSSMTLHWFSRPKETFCRLKKALHSGGHFVFSTLGPSSLREWRQAGLACGIDLGIRDFIPQQLCRESFPEINLHMHTLRQPYNDSWHFLSTLKNVGGTAAQKGHLPVSPVQLKRAMRALDSQNTDGVFITYDILCGCWKKP
ncbi:MAG: methyltransferase domain-containing protein [Holosporales bacterium]|jgi:malonyl-CoA O-methyltransferase|nr:methyltransferase domain-containing protein [Holosporales bacterium]